MQRENTCVKALKFKFHKCKVIKNATETQTNRQKGRYTQNDNKLPQLELKTRWKKKHTHTAKLHFLAQNLTYRVTTCSKLIDVDDSPLFRIFKTTT